MINYPIRFEPILQQKIWGGDKLVNDFNKKSNLSNVGESWEISSVANFVSEVINGNLKGINLTTLIKKFKGDLVGKQVYKIFGNEFPLLFKFIDANKDLSLQLHPNDNIAKKRHGTFGKTEMWYVLDADIKSKLYAGFDREINKKTYLSKLKKGEILDLLCIDTVKKGDAFFIDVGTIHAIGKGILIAEIQQTSDITYRIYDWNRVDSNGQRRELHTDLAVEAIDFSKSGSCKLNYDNKLNVSSEIYSCKFFTTNKLNVVGEVIRNIANIDSFIVYMCVEGKGVISIEGGKENIKRGETLLIPAKTNSVKIFSQKKVELLEVYI